MDTVARRFRVTQFLHSYKTEDEELVKVAPTHFMVELLSLTMDQVEVRHGVVNITLDTAYGLTGDNYIALREELLSRGLLADGGLLDTNAPITPETVLGREKQLRKDAIHAIRDGLETKGFPYMGKWFDSDQRSFTRMSQVFDVALLAYMKNEPFSVDWTTADDSTLVMSGEDVLGIPVAVAAYCQTLHTKYRLLKAQINAATSVEEVRVCVWDGIEQLSETVE
jgi:hypothetical protein